MTEWIAPARNLRGQIDIIRALFMLDASLLNLLEHSDKPTQKLNDEIAEKKGGQADIRARLARRTHIELARFRSEL